MSSLLNCEDVAKAPSRSSGVRVRMAILTRQPAAIPSHELDQLGPVKQPITFPPSALVGKKFIDEIPGIDSMGIWECSPGRWQRTIMEEEFAHFVTGSARFIPTEGG